MFRYSIVIPFKNSTTKGVLLDFKSSFIFNGIGSVTDAAYIQLESSAGALVGCGFACAVIGRACKCRPRRAAKRRNLKRKKM